MKKGIFEQHIIIRTEALVKNGIELEFGWIVNPIVKKVLNKWENEIILINMDHELPYYFYKRILKKFIAMPTL